MSGNIAEVKHSAVGWKNYTTI